MNVDDERIRCAVYARSATKTQKAYPTRMVRNSIERQIALCTRYVEQISGLLVAQYSDTGVVGSQSEDRPGWDALVADAQAGLFDAVIVTEPGRVYRSRTAYSHALSLLDQAEVLLLFARPRGVHGDEGHGR